MARPGLSQAKPRPGLGLGLGQARPWPGLGQARPRPRPRPKPGQARGGWARGWEGGGSVLGTIGLRPRPHALGFAKNVSVG